MRKQKEPHTLSGYFYEHQTAQTSLLFLYCDNNPFDLKAQKTGESKDTLLELLTIYIDLNASEKMTLVELARNLESPAKPTR